MKEKDLLKSVSDRQMPDLEQIRQNILKEAEKQQKPKILKLKPTRLLAVAAILSLSIIGTIAAVANQNGGLFAQKPETTTAETTKATEPTTAKKKNTSSAVVKQKKSSKLTPAQLKEIKTKKYLKRLTDNGFEVTWLYDIGKIDGYHIVYAGNNNFSNYHCDYIMGEFTFSAKKQQSPYGLGLYACSEEHTYTLSDAYKNGIFENFSKVAEMIFNYEKKNLGIIVTHNNSLSNRFRDYMGGVNILTLARIQDSSGYELYFNITDKTEKPEETEKEIDGYTFYINEAQQNYELGLYVNSNNRLYTLEEALDNGILNMDEVFEAVHADSDVPFTFTLHKNEVEIETEDMANIADEETETAVDE